MRFPAAPIRTRLARVCACGSTTDGTLSSRLDGINADRYKLPNPRLRGHRAMIVLLSVQGLAFGV
jgi:hypothetical protein